MLHKLLFIGIHQLSDRNFYFQYKKLLKNQRRSYGDLKQEQDKRLKSIIHFAINNVQYYDNLFKRLNIRPSKIKTIEDLETLPILTKEEINANRHAFEPRHLPSTKYYERATGGTTGTPMQYRISKEDRSLSGALLYRGWGYAGYALGDKMVFFGGGSINVGNQPALTAFFHERTRNIRKLSSFDMEEKVLHSYVATINSFRPKYVRGYATSIFFLANWIGQNDITVNSPDAIFTTAEKLYPHMRKTIENVFSTEVFDGYGLNDGGVSAYECPEHTGLHIDTERSILEVVDKEGHQIERGEGRVIATSLNNYAMPFLRYETGDEAYIIDDACQCGRETRLLKEIVGRSVDILITPEGKSIHGWFFLYIFWKHGYGIKEYQVIQESVDRIVINCVVQEYFNCENVEIIKDIVHEKSPKWNVEFKYVDAIDRTSAGKYKFIINNIR